MASALYPKSFSTCSRARGEPLPDFSKLLSCGFDALIGSGSLSLDHRRYTRLRLRLALLKGTDAPQHVGRLHERFVFSGPVLY